MAFASPPAPHAHASSSPPPPNPHPCPYIRRPSPPTSVGPIQGSVAARPPSAAPQRLPCLFIFAEGQRSASIQTDPDSLVQSTACPPKIVPPQPSVPQPCPHLCPSSARSSKYPSCLPFSTLPSAAIVSVCFVRCPTCSCVAIKYVAGHTYMCRVRWLTVPPRPHPCSKQPLFSICATRRSLGIGFHTSQKAYRKRALRSAVRRLPITLLRHQ